MNNPSKKNRILFGNPEATKIYRECVEAFFAQKPWEVTATEDTLTICNTYKYKLNKRCYLGYEYQVFDLNKNAWVKKSKAELLSSLKRIKYFYFGYYTTFKNIIEAIAEKFFHTFTSSYPKKISLEDHAIVQRLFLSYCRGLYKYHSLKSREIIDWFKKTSIKDIETEVKIGFKVGYYTARHLDTLRLDVLLPNNSFNCDKALSFIELNPDFTALYTMLKPEYRDQKITPSLLNDGFELNIHPELSVQLKVSKKQFNKFKNIGTSAINNYLSDLSNRLTFTVENDRYYRLCSSHVIRYIEKIGIEILLYIYGLHVELGFKRPHIRFMNRFYSRVMNFILRGSNTNWESSKHNIKTIYHAFHKLMYSNLSAEHRNKYIGRSREHNDLNQDMDVIFDYIGQDDIPQLDKRASISGIKIKAQEWIDQKNREKMEAKRQELESINWQPRIIQDPLIIDNYLFNEISNLYDLYLEGTTMNHCVYHNYNNAVLNGDVIVLHIESPEDKTESSTLGLVQDKNRRYEILQNYGRNNSIPSKNIMKAVQKFLRATNKQKALAA